MAKNAVETVEAPTVVEQTVEDNREEQLAFSAGFETNTPPDPPAAKVEVAPVAPVVEVKPEPKPEPKVEPKVQPKVEAKPAEPKYVQVTQEDFDSLKAAAAKVTTIEGQLSKAFGTIGNVQQLVASLQAATPSGQLVELPKDAFAKLRKDFPELADLMQNDMAELFKGIRGTSQTATAPDTAAINAEMDKRVEAATVKIEIEALEDSYPKWREIVGTYGDTANPFRAWLGTQTAEYQTRINSTNSATIISRAIDKFLAATKTAPKPVTPKPAPKVVAQQNRIRGAMQPKGDGGQPAPSKTIVDEFHAGFSSR